MIELKNIGITLHIYDDHIQAVHRYELVAEWKIDEDSNWIREGSSDSVGFDDILDTLLDWIDEDLESMAERDEDIHTLEQWRGYEPTTC